MPSNSKRKKVEWRRCVGCGKKYFNSRSFGNHVVRCLSYPTRAATLPIHHSSATTNNQAAPAVGPPAAAPQQQHMTMHQQRQWINKGKANVERAAIAIAEHNADHMLSSSLSPPPANNMSNEGRAGMGVSTASVSSSLSASQATDYQMLKEENERLRMQVNATRSGRGKNKQTMLLSDGTDITNKMALYTGVRDTIWPHYKFLYFQGSWTVYERHKPHEFAEHVMSLVDLPESYKGLEHKYYEEIALPNVSSKLSTLRSNFVTTCKKKFMRLHRNCRSFDLVGTSFAALLSTANNWDALQDSSAAVDQLYNLIYYYASEVYGRNAIKLWLKANQDKSVLDKVTPSDLAFALLVFENYHPKWVAEIQDEREQEKNQHHQQDADLQDDEEVGGNGRKKNKKKRKVIAGVTLQYTQHPKKKKTYLGSGWNSEGMKRFEELQNLFSKLLANEEAWQNCKDGFDPYIEDKRQHDDIHCWIPTYRRQDVDNTLDLCKGFEFKLPTNAPLISTSSSAGSNPAHALPSYIYIPRKCV